MTEEWFWALYVSISRTDPFLYQYQEPTPFPDPFSFFHELKL